MAHTIEEKKKLLNRVRRIRGQVEAIDRALDQEGECSDVLHNISACRGAMDALMAEVIEGHIRFHILAPHLSEIGTHQTHLARRAPQLNPAPKPANTTGPGAGSHSAAAISMDADEVLPYLEMLEN